MKRLLPSEINKILNKAGSKRRVAKTLKKHGASISEKTVWKILSGFYVRDEKLDEFLKFINNGIKFEKYEKPNTVYVMKKEAKKSLLQKHGTIYKIAKNTNTPLATVYKMFNGSFVSKKTAVDFCKKIKKPVEAVFYIYSKDEIF